MLKLILIMIASLFIIGCDNSTHAYTTGKSLPYCVVEDKQPRIVCINGYLLKENPLFGVQQDKKHIDLYKQDLIVLMVELDVTVTQS